MADGNLALNPWVSIWTTPRATIQQIVEANPERLVLVLSALAGISQVLDRASLRNLGDQWDLRWIFVFALAVGPLAGILGLYVGSALISWTGRWLGGTAPLQNIRAAMAWSNVPIIFALILWIPNLALFGNELFTTEIPRLAASTHLFAVFSVLAVLEMVAGIWAFVILLKSLGQVQGFSAWKALGNILASMLAVAAICGALFGLLMLGKELAQ